jgi:hypothetical protein
LKLVHTESYKFAVELWDWDGEKSDIFVFFGLYKIADLGQ